MALLGGFAFVLFAIVFFRLWFLQVLTGEDYVSQARENRVRKVRIEAPRGDIVDRNGRTLVRTRVAPVVQVVPSQLPESVLDAGRRLPRGALAGGGRAAAAASRLRGLDRELGEDGRRDDAGPAPRAPPAGARGPPRRARRGPAAARGGGRRALALPPARRA